jgi:hypothetical protein
MAEGTWVTPCPLLRLKEVDRGRGKTGKASLMNIVSVSIIKPEW